MTCFEIFSTDSSFYLFVHIFIKKKYICNLQCNTVTQQPARVKYRYLYFAQSQLGIIKSELWP